MAILAIMSGPAAAQSSYDVAMQLGLVLASEMACDLQYNQAAISGFIEANVAADDMEFTSTLQGAIKIAEYQLGEMNGSAKTAHCTQITRVAKSYNFIQ